MKKLVIGDIVSRAWDLSVKHWPIFVLLILAEGCFSSIGLDYDTSAFSSIDPNASFPVIMEAYNNAFSLSPFFIIGFLLACYFGYINVRMMRRAAEVGSPYDSLSDGFKIDIKNFLFYVLIMIAFGLLLGLGYTLCILPGIFLTVRLLFVSVIAATEDVSFGEAFKRSWAITKGHFWELVLLILCSLGIIILGLCACCVGVIFAEVVTNFLFVSAYLTLKENVEYTKIEEEGIVIETPEYVKDEK